MSNPVDPLEKEKKYLTKAVAIEKKRVNSVFHELFRNFKSKDTRKSQNSYKRLS